MAALVPAHLDLLRDALGAAADEVRLVDMGELGANPARIIPAWREFTDEHAEGGRPVRGIGEPVWAGRRGSELAESQLHEALLNTAVAAETPLWLLCPYDADGLPIGLQAIGKPWDEATLLAIARAAEAVVPRQAPATYRALL